MTLPAKAGSFSGNGMTCSEGVAVYRWRLMAPSEPWSESEPQDVWTSRRLMCAWPPLVIRKPSLRKTSLIERLPRTASSRISRVYVTLGIEHIFAYRFVELGLFVQPLVCAGATAVTPRGAGFPQGQQTKSQSCATIGQALAVDSGRPARLPLRHFRVRSTEHSEGFSWSVTLGAKEA